MQIKADTFQKIWAEMTEGQKYSASTAFLQEGCCDTRQTIWNWSKGKAHPQDKDKIAHIAKILGRVTDSRVIPDALFIRRKCLAKNNITA